MKTIHDLNFFLSGNHKIPMGQKVALIPTMGNLHEGHIALIREAKKKADKIVVSIFVNPMQFSKNEDFEIYPRTEESDKKILKQEEVDFLFQPSNEMIYANSIEGHTRVEIPILSSLYCGSSRPHHFVGVSTIVCKLFNIIRPDFAVFGKKDFQQLVIIKKMVRDLAIPVKVIAVDTIRNSEGLAISSRNRYLMENEKIIAPMFFQQLSILIKNLSPDFHNFLELKKIFLRELNEKGFLFEYLELVDAKSLCNPIERVDNIKYVVIAAVKLGRTRLIDNIEIN